MAWMLREYEITRKRTERVESPKKVVLAADVVEALRPLRLEQLDKEQIYCVVLDGGHRLTGYTRVSEGLVNTTLVHAREFFRFAIMANAESVIAVHNHPSGESMPSQADETITQGLKHAGEILGIELLDHIIIGEGNYYSMQENGRL